MTESLNSWRSYQTTDKLSNKGKRGEKRRLGGRKGVLSCVGVIFGELSEETLK